MTLLPISLPSRSNRVLNTKRLNHQGNNNININKFEFKNNDHKMSRLLNFTDVF